MRESLISLLFFVLASLHTDAHAQSDDEIRRALTQARQASVAFRAADVSAVQSQDYISAVLHYRNSLTLLREKPDHPEHLQAALEFARLLSAQNQWIDAANYYGRAASLMEKTASPNFEVRAEASARIAFANLQGQVLSLANVHAQESLMHCAKLHEQQLPCMVTAKRILADAYFVLGDYHQASNLYQFLAQLDEQTYESNQLTGSHAYFQARFWQSQVRSRAWTSEQAQVALQELDNVRPQLQCPQISEVCRELRQAAAELARYIGDLDQANQRIQLALDSQQSSLPFSSRPSREWVLGAQIQLERGELARARTSLIHALVDIEDPYADRTLKMKTLALYYQKMGMAKHEIFWLKRASVWALYAARNYRLSNANTGRVFLAAQLEIFHRLSRLLLEQKRTVEALDILDLYKENQFLDYSGELPNVMRSAAHTEQGMRWKQRYYSEMGRISALMGRGEWPHLSQLDQQESQITKALASPHIAEEDRQEQFAIFEKFLDDFEADYKLEQVNVPDLESEKIVQKKRAMLTNQHSALLEYLVSEDKIYLVLLSKEEAISSYALDIPAKDLKHWIQLHRRAVLSKRDTHSFAKALYKVLIQPAKEELKRLGIQELLIFPDSDLKGLAFGALYDGRRYLIQDYAIKMVNQIEKVDHPKLDAKPILSVFANSLEDETLPFLPAVRAEAAALVNLFKEKHKALELHLDENFNVQAFENAVRQRHQIIHIATHYKQHAFNNDDSFFLTGAQTPLTLSKIKALTQDYSFAELIALSACETDVSTQTQFGMDAEGIGSILLRRGAQSVLATKWEVNDRSSAMLMQRFYRAWLDGESKPQALRRAQLALLKLTKTERKESSARGVRLVKSASKSTEFSGRFPYAHPYYWAGLVLLER